MGLPEDQEFDFTGLNDEQTIVDEDQLEEKINELLETATSGSPDEVGKIHQGLTRKQIETAQKASQTRQGLDMGAFMMQTEVYQIDFDQLLKFKLPLEVVAA